ncbi:MAG TPA: tetratricopeptide repeat protein [Bryobacteraceae bacterium]|nr:tetratricopeptide repeat protein [Bryobacteraceae bacterium]
MYPQIADEPNVFFARPDVASQRGPISALVTVHELRHHVPGRAARDYDRALKAKEKGEDEKAIEYLKKAIAVDPEFSAAINNLGATYLRLDRTDLAVEQFQRAIAVDPHAAVPSSNLALALLMQNEYADAERAARRAVDLNRGGTSGLMVLGASLVLEGKFTAEAERSLKRVAAQFASAKLLLAMWLVGRGEIVTAKEQLRTYIALGEQPGVKMATELLHRIELTR